MKKYKKIMVIFTLLGLLGTSVAAATNTVKGWNDCPKGKHCAAPRCGKYVDTNNNKYCDHGEAAPTTLKAGVSGGKISGLTSQGCSACIGCGACVKG